MCVHACVCVVCHVSGVCGLYVLCVYVVCMLCVYGVCVCVHVTLNCKVVSFFDAWKEGWSLMSG